MWDEYEVWDLKIQEENENRYKWFWNIIDWILGKENEDEPEE
jgi:hypothetical protein